MPGLRVSHMKNKTNAQNIPIMRVSAARMNSESGSEGGNMTQTILSTRQPRQVRDSKDVRSKERSLPHV
jgi:hypothetical protein